MSGQGRSNAAAAHRRQAAPAWPRAAAPRRRPPPPAGRVRRRGWQVIDDPVPPSRSGRLIRIVHRDGKALGAVGRAAPVKCRGLVASMTTNSLATYALQRACLAADLDSASRNETSAAASLSTKSAKPTPKMRSTLLCRINFTLPFLNRPPRGAPTPPSGRSRIPELG